MSRRDSEFRSGFVALIGQPNVGKSTLLNRLLGTHLSIVTPRPQTTRTRVRGVLTLTDRAQIVFVDTPGIHEWQEKALNKAMVQSALGALTDADAVVHIIDARHAIDNKSKSSETGETSATTDTSEAPGVNESERQIIAQLAQTKAPVILAINKIDTLSGPELALPIIDAFRKAYQYKAIIPLSAREGTQTEALVDELVRALPAGPMLYPADVLTDQAERFFVAELVREQIMRLTKKEIPYSVAVEVEQFVESPGDGLVKIEAVIHVERDSQKVIIIGKKGQMLRDIGQRSREAIARFLGKRVHLQTFVRVQPDWAQDQRSLQRFGYDPEKPS